MKFLPLMNNFYSMDMQDTALVKLIASYTVDA